MKYFIKTFGCQQNIADSERIAAAYKSRGFIEAKQYKTADHVIINTCMVRQSAEDRVYGLVQNLAKLKTDNQKLKIIVTGCMVGLAFRDTTGQYLQKIRERMPEVDEFIPIEEVGFNNEPLRQDKKNAWVPISNGCNNFCTFCVVPFTRGREISRPFEDIINECKKLFEKGFENVMLLGQNVNSYGADLIYPSSVIPNEVRDLATPSTRVYPEQSRRARNDKQFKLNGNNVKPTYVKHLGRYRIPTLFPHLLESVARIGFKKVDFISSNPWDFSDELIDVIAKNENITRTIHLPVQSGDTNVLRRMNRWYTCDEYLQLVANLKLKIKNLKLTTDIIVGFCGETDKEFQNTVDLCKKVDFLKAYVSMYSPRFGTAATKVFADDIPHKTKQERWEVLEELIYRSKRCEK